MSRVEKESPSRFSCAHLRVIDRLLKVNLRIGNFLLTLALFAGCPPMVHAQLYVGALTGISTVSSDARSVLSPSSSSFSLYDPKNGPALAFVVGKHLSDYFTVQADYVWNRNSLTLTSSNFAAGLQTAYEEKRSSSQHSIFVEALVYFRDKKSRLRPYLSVGTGVVHLSSSEQRVSQTLGAPILPPQNFSSNVIALRVPVGMDVKLGKGWAIRYTFSETLSKNPISDRLSPAGQHSLKNFENLFGLVKQFR
jgi:Outer membrane protein beta-barrel domain